MTLQEMMAQFIREIYAVYTRNGEPYEMIMVLNEMGRLFGVDVEKIVEEMSSRR